MVHSEMLTVHLIDVSSTLCMQQFTPQSLLSLTLQQVRRPHRNQNQVFTKNLSPLVLPYAWQFHNSAFVLPCISISHQLTSC